MRQGQLKEVFGVSQILCHHGSGGGRKDQANLPRFRICPKIPMPHTMGIPVPRSSIDRGAGTMIVKIVRLLSAAVKLLWVVDINRVGFVNLKY